MADTVRSLAAILALFANNTAGDISAQDLRDFAVSTSPPHGQIYCSTSAATAITTGGTYYKLAGTTSLASPADLFDMPANNRLRYTGTTSITARISFHAGFSASVSETVSFKLLHSADGLVAASLASNNTSTGTDVFRTVSGAAMVTMTQDQYIELHATTVGSSKTVTAFPFSIVAQGLFE